MRRFLTCLYSNISPHSRHTANIFISLVHFNKGGAAPLTYGLAPLA
jgi:hypothetical protein